MGLSLPLYMPYQQLRQASALLQHCIHPTNHGNRSLPMHSKTVSVGDKLGVHFYHHSKQAWDALGDGEKEGGKE